MLPLVSGLLVVVFFAVAEGFLFYGSYLGLGVDLQWRSREGFFVI